MALQLPTKEGQGHQLKASVPRWVAGILSGLCHPGMSVKVFRGSRPVYIENMKEGEKIRLSASQNFMLHRTHLNHPKPLNYARSFIFSCDTSFHQKMLSSVF